MQPLAPGVFMLPLQPRNAINAYLLGDVLIDAGIRQSETRLKHLLRHAPPRAHALTHAHPDHQGASHAICRHFDIPLWTSAQDAAHMQAGNLRGNIPRNAITCLQERVWTGPAQPVQRVLREGDLVGEFEVLETPGHAPGHLAFWRASDRVLILGDVLVNLDFRTFQPRLHEPPAAFTVDRAVNRASIQRVADLRPQLVAFGHGRPIRDAAAFRTQVRRILAAPA